MKTHFLKYYPILSLCTLALIPIPIFFIAASFYFETEKLSLLEERMELLCQKQARMQAETKKEKRFLEQLKQADRLYVDRVLKLKFAEETARVCETVKEVELQQEHWIEVNENELKRLLTLIENVPTSGYAPYEKKPQLLIKHLHLSKKQISLYQSVFLLNMQLIKREGLL